MGAGLHRDQVGGAGDLAALAQCVCGVGEQDAVTVLSLLLAVAPHLAVEAGTRHARLVARQAVEPRLAEGRERDALVLRAAGQAFEQRFVAGGVGQVAEQRVAVESACDHEQLAVELGLGAADVLAHKGFAAQIFLANERATGANVVAQLVDSFEQLDRIGVWLDFGETIP